MVWNKPVVFIAKTSVVVLFAQALFLGQLLAQSPPTSYPKNVDFGVSGITLSYRQSAEEVLGSQLVLLPIENGRESLTCFNKNQEEILELTHYTGRWKNSFQQFRVLTKSRFAKAEGAAQSQASLAAAVSKTTPGATTEPTVAEKRNCALPVKQFISERGIHLGMSLSEVTSRFGGHFKVDTQGVTTVIIYAIETNLASDFLKHYDALSYYGRYYFHGGKLVEFSIGLDNL